MNKNNPIFKVEILVSDKGLHVSKNKLDIMYESFSSLAFDSGERVDRKKLNKNIFFNPCGKTLKIIFFSDEEHYQPLYEKALKKCEKFCIERIQIYTEYLNMIN